MAASGIGSTGSQHCRDWHLHQLACTHQKWCSQSCKYMRHESRAVHDSMDLEFLQISVYFCSPDMKIWWKILGIRLHGSGWHVFQHVVQALIILCGPEQDIYAGGGT